MSLQNISRQYVVTMHYLELDVNNASEAWFYVATSLARLQT